MNSTKATTMETRKFTAYGDTSDPYCEYSQKFMPGSRVLLSAPCILPLVLETGNKRGCNGNNAATHNGYGSEDGQNALAFVKSLLR